ncbi:hypothetical protein OC842_002439 [Tilletia horrida]|uniref:Uncharacterized protein n=1 Tax=Tilletia horrida TaxID=155126 RepID=A0AAN6GEK3_9BASI|nr:hypothetical protein OC842_002439 [Tilletia horrida]
MAADEFDEDDMFDGITEEDLERAEFQASQQLQKPRQPLRANPVPPRPPALQNPYQRQQPPPRARPLPPPPPLVPQQQQQQRQHQQPPQHAHGRAPIPPVVPAKRAAPPHDYSQAPSGRVSPSLGLGALQPALGRLPGTKRVQPPFKPPFKKPKTEPVVPQVSLIPPPQPPSRPNPYAAAIAANKASTMKGASADDPIDDLDDDEFWANVDVEAEELIATQQVRAGPARSQSSASPEKRRIVKSEPNANESRPHPPHPPRPSPPTSKVPAARDVEDTRRAEAEAAARAKVEEENTQMKRQLEKMRQELWTKQGEDKMLRQRLQKAEADRIALESEKERMRTAHQEELRRVNSQKDEDLKRMHDVAQFKAMEAETSRRTPQWPIRRPPSSVHRSGSQYRTPQFMGLRTPTKSAEKRRQEQQERRQLSQDSPTRRANAAPKPLPAAFSGFDNSFVVPALPNKSKGKAPAAPTPAKKEVAMIAPNTPIQSESLAAFDDYAFDEMADALSSPPRLGQTQTPRTSPQRAPIQEPIPPDIVSQTTTPAAWKLWARQVYAIRCNDFVSDVISFGCALPTPVSSLPRSKLLPVSIMPAPAVPSHPLVIHRLMDINLPEETHQAVKDLWQCALERLLEVCADAGRNLSDSFFVHPSAEALATSANVVDEAERIFWSYQEQIEDAMLHVLQSLAALLRVLSCILLRLCMLDALQDVLLVLSRTMRSNRSFVHAMLLNESPLQALALSFQDFGVQGKEQDFRVNALLKPPAFPRLLIEVVRKTYAVPLRVAHEPSAIENDSADKGEQPEEEVWDIGEECREEILVAVASCLKCLDLDDPQARLGAIAFVEEPGMVMTYIHPNSPPKLQRVMLEVLLPFTAAQYEWMNVLACDFASDLPGYIRPMRGLVQTPLIDVLGRQLADGNDTWSWEEYHQMHCSILVFFSQLLIHKGDSARTFLGRSKQVLAAVIKSTHRDSTTMWLQPDLVDKTDQYELTRVVDRICINLRFLCLLCLTPTSNIDLANRMREYDSRGSVHKGVRQLFNVAFGRIACIASPDYLNQPDREDFAQIRVKLDHAYDLANDILDKSLTPDEVAALFEQMGKIFWEPEGGLDDETQTQEEEDVMEG